MSDATWPSDQPAPAGAAAARVSPRGAWTLLAYLLLVILFGAWVRISGSGAGCGQHWPTCQGEVLHVPRTVATATELTHRLMSGVSLAWVLLAARRTRAHAGPGSLARRAAHWSVLFIVGEALVGALLVLAGLVGDNASLARAVVMGLHLVNTCFLVAAVAANAWFTARPDAALVRATFERSFRVALGAFLIVASAGAVTALGDTVLPPSVGDVGSHLAHDLDRRAHFLEQWRAVHPLLALGLAALLVWIAVAAVRRDRAGTRLGRGLLAALVGQVTLGALNVALSAPGWLQIAHLAVSNALWLLLVLAYLSARTVRARPLPVAGGSA